MQAGPAPPWSKRAFHQPCMRGCTIAPTCNMPSHRKEGKAGGARVASSHSSKGCRDEGCRDAATAQGGATKEGKPSGVTSWAPPAACASALPCRPSCRRLQRCRRRRPPLRPRTQPPPSNQLHATGGRREGGAGEGRASKAGLLATKVRPCSPTPEARSPSSVLMFCCLRNPVMYSIVRCFSCATLSLGRSARQSGARGRFGRWQACGMKHSLLAAHAHSLPARCASKDPSQP